MRSGSTSGRHALAREHCSSENSIEDTVSVIRRCEVMAEEDAQEEGSLAKESEVTSNMT